MNKLNKIIAMSAFDAARALQSRTLSAQDYVKAGLERIAAREPEVQAFAFINPELALSRAKTLDAGAIQGPLHGLTLGVKDVFDTWDMPTQGGSKAFAGYQPVQDAACLATARKQGVVIMGKTVTTELATFPTNGTRNPLNLEHTPGGSSSGSAAAVADDDQTGEAEPPTALDDRGAPPHLHDLFGKLPTAGIAATGIPISRILVSVATCGHDWLSRLEGCVLICGNRDTAYLKTCSDTPTRKRLL